MLPEILGCYQSQKQERMGKGGTTRGFVQYIDWLAVRLDPARILLFPLGDDRLPMPLQKSVTPTEFLEHFLPEPLVFQERLAPAASVLARLLRDGNTNLELAALPKAERSLYAAILAALGSGGAQEPTRAARAMFEAVSNGPDGGDAQKLAINAFGIHLRKQKDFDTAVAYYRKALELAPGDERLLFNLARALFEKGDIPGCQAVLEQALEADPAFGEARKFLRYLDKVADTGRRESFPDLTV